MGRRNERDRYAKRTTPPYVKGKIPPSWRRAFEKIAGYSARKGEGVELGIPLLTRNIDRQSSL
ncbi:hypothetical protein WN51_05020 [Melipona quadrifasciata]|uniref:Uncharacterized protein n=1 Tax=Melipona quadrifasciata TaxID=166423 RepID=A0A0M8ZRP2_9HYME|nr:hypothetical protein WN51_05020 [Melipona quadrifasciata]